MGRRGTRSRRRAWLAGRVAALLVVLVAGILAIAHYSSWGIALTGENHAAGSRAGASAARAAAAAKTAMAGTQPDAAAPAATATAKPAAKAGARHARPGPARSAAAAGQSAAGPAYFRTLPPGAKLPSGAQCARWVRARPRAENKGANKGYNHTTGQHVGASFFPAGDSPRAGQLLASRINGDFTGTTSQILRWAACKWGIDQDVVFAQAAVESWWQQDTLGDWGTDKTACPPGHGLGQDGKKGQCPQSYGILQNRFPYEQATWPGIADSTAMNADAAYAIWRSCFDGYETWLSNVPHGQPYHAGDLWGCVGRWFAGRWHTSAASQYVTKVKSYLHQRIWLTPDFQQP
ncbi:MAG TPA: hypothetical protein VH637_06455 [Streptosporangiaceae bacterium]|jgi:autotransporter family porin